MEHHETSRIRFYKTFCAVCCFWGLTIGAGASIAQTTSTEVAHRDRFETAVFGIGLNASLCSGMGVSFKEHLAQLPFAYQLTIGAFKTGSLSLFSGGAEVQYDLSVRDADRLYTLLGFGFYYKGEHKNDLSSPTRLGLGVGYELGQSGTLSFAFNGMLTYFTETGDILPLPSVSLFYYFH